MNFMKNQINEVKNKKIARKEKGITLLALVITIVLNCSYLAMEQIKKLKKYRTSCII